MGISDYSNTIGKANFKNEDMNGFAREVWGIDMSIHLMGKAKRCAQFARDLAAVPQMSVMTHIRGLIVELDRCFLRYKMGKPFAVFDGRRNPAKLAENAAREGKRAESLARARALMVTGTNPDELDSLLKAAAYITDDVIRCAMEQCRQLGWTVVMAVGEADPQLNYLLSRGYIRRILSTDSDISAIGAGGPSSWVTNISISAKTPFATTVSQVDVLTSLGSALKAYGAPFSVEEHRMMCVLLGCDYLKRVPGCGPAAVKKIMSLLLAAEAPISIDDVLTQLQELGEVGSKRKTSVGHTDVNPHYKRDFWRAYNLMAHPLVFAFEMQPNEGVITDVKLALLDGDVLEWSQCHSLFGFDPREPQLNPTISLVDTLSCKDNYYIRIGRIIPPLSHPVSEDGRMLPWGSTRTLRDAHGEWVYHPSMLNTAECDQWLRSRNETHHSKSHDMLYKRIITILDIIVPLPIRTATDNEGAGYQRYQHVKARQEGQPVQWVEDGDGVFLVVRTMSAHIDYRYVNAVFPPSQRGVIARSKRLLLSGAYDMDTLKYAPALAVHAEINLPAVMFMIEAVPSCLANPYSVCLLFREDNGSFLTTPHSYCTCPHGTLFCSHMLGFLNVLGLIQSEGSHNFEQYKDRTPQPIKSITSLVMLLSYIDR